jgi:GNAT superfamily N-acetyltransferase
MEVRGARRNEREEVLDLLTPWHNDREFFARYNKIDPTFRDELCLVARDGGRLVSTVQIFDRAVNLDGQAVPMGGIGSVFTAKEYRHKRVASALMQLAVETMTREGFEVSLLFADRLTFYNQFGWREVGRTFSVLTGAAGMQSVNLDRDRDRDRDGWDRFEIDVFDEARDFAEVVAIHRAYSGRFNVTAVRDEPGWRANLRFAGNQPSEGSEEYFTICRERSGRIAAYARVTRLYGISMVMEFGYRPGDFDAMLATFKYLAEEASGAASTIRRVGDHRGAALLRGSSERAAPSTLVTHTAHDPELEKRLAEAGCPIVHHVDNNYMWRVLAPESLARRFAMTPEAASTHAFDLFSDSGSLFWTADRF